MKAVRFYMPGVLLILAALIIVMVPEVLVAFIAALFAMAGIGALRVGHIIRKSTAGNTDFNGWYGERDFSGRQFARVPVSIRWRGFR